MRITKDNINEYLNPFGYLSLYYNEKITHIDYIPDNIKYIDIECSYVEEITCDLPDGIEKFYCDDSKLTKLPLLPKSVHTFYGRHSNLPNEFKINITEDNIRCNKLRKLQLLELI